MKPRDITILMIVYLLTLLTSNAQDKIMARDKFIWDNYDSTSTIIKDSIQQTDLRGNWISRELSIYGDYSMGAKSIGDGQAGTLEIKGDKWRNTLSGDFHTFRLYKNMIIFSVNNSSDTAYINRISQKELTISYKRGKDFMQYFYVK